MSAVDSVGEVWMSKNQGSTILYLFWLQTFVYHSTRILLWSLCSVFLGNCLGAGWTPLSPAFPIHFCPVLKQISDSKILFLIWSKLCCNELGFCDIQFWSYLNCFWFLFLGPIIIFYFQPGRCTVLFLASILHFCPRLEHSLILIWTELFSVSVGY